MFSNFSPWGTANHKPASKVEFQQIPHARSHPPVQAQVPRAHESHFQGFMHSFAQDVFDDIINFEDPPSTIQNGIRPFAQRDTNNLTHMAYEVAPAKTNGFGAVPSQPARALNPHASGVSAIPQIHHATSVGFGLAQQQQQHQQQHQTLQYPYQHSPDLHPSQPDEAADFEHDSLAGVNQVNIFDSFNPEVVHPELFSHANPLSTADTTIALPSNDQVVAAAAAATAATTTTTTTAATTHDKNSRPYRYRFFQRQDRRYRTHHQHRHRQSQRQHESSDAESHDHDHDHDHDEDHEDDTTTRRPPSILGVSRGRSDSLSPSYSHPYIHFPHDDATQDEVRSGAEPKRPPVKLPKKKHVCDTCKKSFKTAYTLRRHQAVHASVKPFTCTVDGCGKSFTTKTSLDRHIRIHTNDKRYVCSHPGCGHCFVDKANMKRHEMTHTAAKPFLCEVDGCGKSFTRNQALQYHKTVFHNKSSTGEVAAVAQPAPSTESAVLVVEP